MKGIKTETISINSTGVEALSEVFDLAKTNLVGQGKTPLRMVVLEKDQQTTLLLVSYIYETKK